MTWPVLVPNAASPSSGKPADPLDRRLIAGLAGIKLLLHLLLANRYGYFRDELYFLDCARHLDWGYVDHAPLVAVYAKVALLLGGSLPALRAIAAVAGAALVVLAILLAREMGGGRFAQALAGLCVFGAPIYLVSGGLLSMNAFEPLFWMGCIFVLIRIVKTGNSRLWVWFGLLAGLGLQNKHSTLLFGFAVAVAIVLSPERRELGRRWIWIGGAIAVLVFLPNLIWQAAHGFPTLEDLENVRQTGKNIALNPLEFFGQQIFLLNPALFPVWLAGIVSLMAGRRRKLQVLGWTYIVLLVTMIALKAKNYYLSPIYPMLFAAGAVAIEGWLARRAAIAPKVWPRAAILSYAAIVGAAMVPAVMPVLPPENLVGYQRALGLAPPKTEVAHSGPLPQFLGDQFGWPELVAEVARIHHALPPDERARTGIVANNYGEAGALNQFGPALGLPRPVSAHQTHFFWGPGDTPYENYIVLQSDPDDLKEVCASVEEAGRHFHPWGMVEENRPIHLCRGLRTPLREMWPRLKHWN